MTAISTTVLLLDNYDSFTYNLYQYLSELGAAVGPGGRDKLFRQ
jgi:anthranilate/para-aminobenzoate synthase component II